MRYLILVFLSISFLFTSCKTDPTKSLVNNRGEIEKDWIEEGITKDYIFARGIGAADKTLESETQRKATSRNAAIVNAQYNMLSIIKGVQLEGGITVEKAIETDSLLETRINAVIRGAEIVRTQWTNDDGCVVILRLPKTRLKDMGLKLAE